jgi:hypothetical protein
MWLGSHLLFLNLSSLTKSIVLSSLWNSLLALAYSSDEAAGCLHSDHIHIKAIHFKFYRMTMWIFRQCNKLGASCSAIRNYLFFGPGGTRSSASWSPSGSPAARCSSLMQSKGTKRNFKKLFSFSKKLKCQRKFLIDESSRCSKAYSY